ncbi:MAG: VWA domain-containing protein [Vicinamibacterales bacterium]
MRLGVVIVMGLLTSLPVLGAAQESRPTFRTTVDRVTLSVSVRTSRGRQVPNLKATDFKLYDSGILRQVTEFRADPTPVSLAFLVDFSGSMDVASRRTSARDLVQQLLDCLTPGTDQAGLYVFDKQLRELQPVAPAPGTILAQLDRVERPFGVTSLFDAIAETGKQLAAHGGLRRALVAVTDGADNASKMTPEEVSALASSIDVPVYIIVVVSPFDRAGRGTVDDARLVDGAIQGPLGNLARWTGGEIYAGITPLQSSKAAQEIVTDLRQQYVITFEPGRQAGWHPLEVRTRDENHVVRTRSGYVVDGR